MAKKLHKENTVGPWAAEKLGALERYLNYYTTALKNKTYLEKIYIDAFAGAGVSKLRKGELAELGLASLFEFDDSDLGEAEQYLNGSPRVALGLETPFDKYIFIERDSTRVQELSEIREASLLREQIEIREDDASAALLDLSGRVISRKKNRVVVFIDPYGLNISWGAIRALGDTGATEVIINFAWAMAINRLMVRDGEIPQGWRAMLDRFFGDSNWFQLAYEIKPNLFGEAVAKVAAAERRILKYYLEKLRTCFGHVAPPMLVRNTKGNPLYYLIWAGPHPLGLKGAEHVLSQGETVVLEP